MNVLVSLTDKSGSDGFLKEISSIVDRIYASEGTKKYLEENGVECHSISELTGFDELLGGRVKTLHPAVFSGILMQDNDDDRKQVEGKGYFPFDIVMCNLYDFSKYSNGSEEEKIEHIDIGGVSLIRAAAKNWKRVAILKNREDYAIASSEIQKTGKVSLETRKKLALDAFKLTYRYDMMIYNSLSGSENGRIIEMVDGKKLRYGENPDQEGFIYNIPEYGKMEVFHGKEMSYNNYVDASSAIETALDFSDPFAVVIKHNTPCGAATGKDHGEALLKAIDADRESAYGSVICVNGVAGRQVAEAIKDLFVEIIIAKDFDDEGKRMIGKKKNIRMIKYSGSGPDRNFKTLFNGILEQTRMNTSVDQMKEVVHGRKDFSMKEIEFAWKIAAHCRSNAIVLAKGCVTVGVGAGQTSRVEATKIACSRAGSKANGSIMASDAYIPFSDNVDVAKESGIAAIVEPGGSIRDQDVIDSCTNNGISLYFTGRRVFLH
ncbi:MAG: bifunctional phosphoribosylaminoimidazolecarboxamide formyltransferase/IMP cyclohydrolase [Candidatus Thermoplasmatota archaeon]|nr:bifunctional phosphoribosylaminoimidazolecarboxamide formyltransferase/IMP cyclohydrolase [Candidatus Thermoplasmatota archaeon]MCL5889076.1 bifunctional phosphoribosylaminoimidazolecarboxamide formyltransferase/IMP cyclohydrolase [Candidatus Thermoplasmatota archaeon]